MVVVTGAGRAFCVGADLKAWSRDYLGKPDEYWKWFGAFKDAHDRLREIGKPTLARINGVCVGGGNELQMACDLSVIADEPYIRHVGPQHGSVPASGATSGSRSWSASAGRARSSSSARRSRRGRRRSGASSTARCRPSSTRPWTSWSRSSPPSSTQTVRYTKQQLNFWRDLAWHETVNHARDWLALSMATEEPKAASKFLEGDG